MAETFIHGKATRLLISKYDMSAYFNGVEADASAASHETTTLGKTTVTRSAGLKDGKVTLNGLFEATADGLVASWLGSAAGEAFTFCPGGDTAGGPCQIGKVLHQSYKASSPVGGMVAASASLECRSDYEAFGKVLHVLGAETETGAETSVDGGAHTHNGGFATIHCTASAGTLPTLDVKLQHAEDNSSWADFAPSAAFTQLITTGSETITIAAGTTVDRYVREYHTIGGSAGQSFTYLVGFARR
jgi:hypothetical protein